MENSASETSSTVTVVREELAGGVCVLHLHGALRWPVRPQLRRRVEELLHRGTRTILLDLAGVSAVDAAGVGELVRVWQLVEAAGGDLWIDNPGRKARTLLAHAGLLELLSVDGPFGLERCS